MCGASRGKLICHLNLFLACPEVVSFSRNAPLVYREDVREDVPVKILDLFLLTRLFCLFQC